MLSLNHVSVKTREGMKFDDFIDVLFHYKKDYLAILRVKVLFYLPTYSNERIYSHYYLSCIIKYKLGRSTITVSCFMRRSKL